MNIPQLSNGQCSTDYMMVSPDGNKSLIVTNYLCGSGSLQVTSLFNYIAFGYASNTATASGWFTCTLQPQVQACDCGWSVNTKIVGGASTAVNEFPHMAGIVSNSQIICGGTIISYRYIMTAAHCALAFPNAAQLGVLVGDHDYTIGTETFFSDLYPTTQWIVHENFNPNTYMNDIALLKTVNDLKYSRGVGPICLPFVYATQDFSNNAVDAAGWGTQTFGGPVSTFLRKVQLFVYTNADCSRLVPMDSTKICSYAPGKDTCQYDSGTSLVYRGTRFYSVGIVSFGFGCGAAAPAVNTRVTSYLSWIQTRTPDATYCVK